MFNYTSDLGLPSFEQVLEDSQKGSSALLLVSGGLDSAYFLWKYAQVNKQIQCHHTQMYPSMRKTVEMENQMVRCQIDYLKECNIDLLTTTVDSDGGYTLMRDWYLVVLLSIHRAVERGCKYIVTGDCLPSSYVRNLEHSNIKEFSKQEVLALKEFVNIYGYGRVQLCIGSDSKSLGSDYQDMPLGYVKNTFSCRNPVFKDGNVKICRKCESCIKNELFGFSDVMSTSFKLDFPKSN